MISNRQLRQHTLMNFDVNPANPAASFSRICLQSFAWNRLVERDNFSAAAFELLAVGCDRLKGRMWYTDTQSGHENCNWMHRIQNNRLLTVKTCKQM